MKDTAENVEIDIAASSDVEAMAIASRLNLFTESVEPIIQTKPKTIPACQSCGVVIEPDGVLRVVGEECFCVDCYSSHMGSSSSTPLPRIQSSLDSPGVQLIPIESSEPVECQSCGAAIEQHGVLRVLGQQRLCRSCYAKQTVRSNDIRLPWRKEVLESLGLTAVYDEFADVTRAIANVHLEGNHGPFPVEGTAEVMFFSLESVDLRASFPGRVQSAPVDGVNLSLRFSCCGGQLFPKRLRSDLVLMLDGKRVIVKVGEWLKSSSREDGMTSYVEEVHLCINQPLVSQLLLATDVRGKLGPVTMELTELVHEPLGALAKVVKFREM